MTFLLVLGCVLAWCALSVPLAMLVGRALAGRHDTLGRPERPGRPAYDLAA